MWKINFYSDAVKNEIRILPSGIRAKFIRMSELMQEFGPNLGMPYTRAMGDGLFEMRLQGREGIGRILYCTIIGQTIVILHNFIKKTQKTPKRELDKAVRRMKEVKKNHEL